MFTAYDDAVGEHRLFCDQNGDFTLLIVADPQCDTKTQWCEARDELETLIKRSNPDFVLINGDMNSKNIIPKTMWDMFVSPITNRGLPWSTTNGNHDPYNSEIYDMYKNYNGCINNTVGRSNLNYEADRPMNYVIPIYSNNGKKIVFAIYALDSGTSNQYGYEGVTKRQINWYIEQSNALKRQNGGRLVVSVMCMHIPITQTLDMFYSNQGAFEAKSKVWGGLYRVYGTTNQDGAAVTDYYCQNGTHIEKTYLHTTAPQNDRGIFDAVLKQGDVKAMIFGHEHKTNMIGSYKGVLLGFAGKLSTGCYSDEVCRGGRIIKFNQQNPEKFTTQWLGTLPASIDQPAIYSDGSIAK